MSARVYRDVFNAEVAMADAVRETILAKHPESAEFIDLIDRVLAAPDQIRQSVRDERSVLYYRFEPEMLNGKWVVVVVKQIDRNYVSTVYAMDKEHLMQLAYDREADVLYLSVGAPRPAISREIGDDVLLRIAPETGEIIGLTVLNLSPRSSRGALPIAVEMHEQAG